MEEIKIQRSLRYDYNDQEKIQLSKELAECNNKLRSLEEEKKTYQAQMKATIAEQTERIGGLSLKITNGYEFREVECTVQLQYPKDGIKIVTRHDTGETWQEKMLPTDYDLFNQPGIDNNSDEVNEEF